MKHIKLFESIEDEYEVLATNESSHSWEYDIWRSEAKILLDKNDNSLYLKITKVHIKTGIGSGTYPGKGEFIKIGNLQKADLKMVRELLKKHSYEQSKFSTFWEDNEGNKITLTDLLKTLKPEKQKKELKHIKSINYFDEPIKTKDIDLVKYSEYSHALFGEGTKAIKDQLSSLGCKYNKFLTDPKTGQKRVGWICSNKILDKVKKLI